MGCGQVMADMSLQSVSVRRGHTSFQLNDRHGHLVQDGIVGCDHRGDGDGFVPSQNLLDRFREYLEPSAHDRSIGSSDAEQEAIRINRHQVRG